MEVSNRSILRPIPCHPDRGLEGDPPLKREQSDATPLVEVPADQLHHLLLARVPRIASKSEIRLSGRTYNAAELGGWGADRRGSLHARSAGEHRGGVGVS